ncbi:MAG: Cof-type HAD-IIB family hydrolase [Lacisediminihabitans sp.]
MKLVAIDLDGTLLTSAHEVSPATIEAVAETRAAGVEVVLASSRGIGSMRPILGKLQLFSPAEFISAQGALTGSLDRTGVLRISAISSIPLALARQVVALTEGADIQIGWYRGLDWFVPALNAMVEHEAATVRQRPTVRNLFEITLAPEKLLLVSTPDRVGDLQSLAKSLPDGLAAQFSHSNYLEVTREGVDKGAALSRICEARRIAPVDVVAIGDGFNDLGLFAFAGVSVAMANAPEAVRAAATMVTGSNDEDGVASALRMLARV